MRNILLVVSVLALSAGAARADRFHGRRDVRPERRVVFGGYHREGRAPIRYEGRRYERRWSYEAPRVHYYNRWERPALIVEHYDVRPGFVWVRGEWAWDGYEWIWQPGHYVRVSYDGYYGY